jgi:DNA repair protein RecO (recombination protein O)
MVLLEDLGFGLDLTSCAVTGETSDLAFVSPKSGRAVTAAGAGSYAHRLLRLPAFLLGDPGGPSARDVKDGLELTGHFLERVLSESSSGSKTPGFPEARLRFSQRVRAMD